MGDSYLSIAPELILVGAAVLVLMVDVFAEPPKRVHAWIVGGTYLAAGLAIVAQWDRVSTDGPTISWGGTIVLSSAAVGFRAVLLIVAVLGMATAWRMLVELDRRAAEGISLMLVASSGLTGTDRTLGVAFGLARGVVVGAVVVMLAGMTEVRGSQPWEDSKLRPHLQPVADWLLRYMPDTDPEELLDSARDLVPDT